MRKTVFLIFIIACSLVQARTPDSDKARGMFLSFNVGPRIPLGIFANTSKLGYGFNVELDYTDNEYLPVFLFGKIGYDQFPGSQEYYQTSPHTHYSINFVPFTIGARYYFAPILENFVLVMPCVEVGANMAIYQKLHQFKLSAGLPSYIEDGTKFGYEISGGFSMFLAEILATYHYYSQNQFLSVDLRVRLPLFVSF